MPQAPATRCKLAAHAALGGVAALDPLVPFAELCADAASYEAKEGVGIAPQSGSPLDSSARRARIVWLVILIVVYGVSLAVSRTGLPHIPLCMFHNLTNLPCPTCGLTRAFTEIGHGNFAAATALNVMAIPVYLLGLCVLTLLCYEMKTGRHLLTPLVTRHRTLLLLLLAGSVTLRYIFFALD